jgi:hypothetical protein
MSLGQVQVTARVVAGTDRGAKGGMFIGGEISDVPSAPEVIGDEKPLGRLPNENTVNTSSPNGSRYRAPQIPWSHQSGVKRALTYDRDTFLDQ